ncbi:lipoyl domain-containing protein [Acetobacterium sp.]|jgi:pyruvate/2-oxoglutarate dehydrogenase complex dihydrolipoamide acyltransferase (E2) component|uniref:lipoyl domain-containing protein n=1 Tax=Acetobacterium sp. TaxID=1872094 RepID=UPI003593B5A4
MKSFEMLRLYRNIDQTNLGGEIMVEVQVPMIGQSGMDVRIEVWMIEEGEHVEKGEALYELSNEKLNQEIESPATGTLVKILVQEGETVAVGDILAHIEE